MKKQLLSALMVITLSAPTLTHPIALKTIFDMSMILAATLSYRNKFSSLTNHHLPTLVTHLGIYAYAIPSLWKAYKDYKKNDGKIQVKQAK